MEDGSKFGYENLDVWQRAITWASDIIDVVEKLKTDRKHYRLIEQLEAASASVAMNIAEGKGRYSRKEFAQFLYVARGSLYEAVTLLEILLRQGWIESATFQKIKTDATEIAKMLNGLINSIKEAPHP